MINLGEINYQFVLHWQRWFKKVVKGWNFLGFFLNDNWFEWILSNLILAQNWSALIFYHIIFVLLHLTVVFNPTLLPFDVFTGVFLTLLLILHSLIFSIPLLLYLGELIQLFKTNQIDIPIQIRLHVLPWHDISKLLINLFWLILIEYFGVSRNVRRDGPRVVPPMFNLHRAMLRLFSWWHLVMRLLRRVSIHSC